MADHDQLPETVQQHLSENIRKDHLERLRKFRGRLPKHFVFDRDEANER
jgi:hypothetical protein